VIFVIAPGPVLVAIKHSCVQARHPTATTVSQVPSRNLYSPDFSVSMSTTKSVPKCVRTLPIALTRSSQVFKSLKFRPPALTTGPLMVGSSFPLVAPKPSLISDIASLQKLGEHYVWISVSESSRATYQTGFRRWQKFVVWLGTDIMMEKIPPEWSAACNRPGYVAQPWYESCVAAFLCWMRNIGNVVEPKTAFNYLAGVSHYLQNYGMNTAFLRSPFIKATKNGMLNEWTALPGNSVAERRRIPISIDMIMAVLDSFPRPLSFENLAVYTAMIFAFITASRISEYLPASSATLGHAILSENIVFTIASGPFAGRHLPSYLCHDTNLDDISAVFIFIRNAKNEQEGKGNRISYSKDVISESRVFDAVSVLWSYTIRAKPVQHAPFFMSSFGNSTWTLCRPTFNIRLKEIATIFGLDPSRVASHSLRGGLASTLAVAQVPSYVYQSLGGWSSECYTTYQTATTTVYDDIHKILANPTVLTVQDIKLSTCSTLTSVPCPPDLPPKFPHTPLKLIGHPRVSPLNSLAPKISSTPLRQILPPSGLVNPRAQKFTSTREITMPSRFL